MTIHRTEFLEALARNTPSLGLVCMNHSGSPTKLLTDISTITFLADKQSRAAFIEYCRYHTLVKEITIHPHYRWLTIIVAFKDGSELDFTIMPQLVRKTLVCMDIRSVKPKSFVNEYGMLVPAPGHHYEFMILNCQFSKYILADRYRNYFSTFDFATRASIFRYIQEKFNLVFNTLEDLYEPKPGMLLSIVVGLRSEKSNTLLRMLFRSMEHVSFNLFGFITKKTKRISPSSHHSPEVPSSAKNRAAGNTL